MRAVENWHHETALMWASNENNAAAVEVLVKAGADLRARAKEGFTALLFAVRAGHLETVRALLRLGADVNELLPDGTSAMVVAIINAHYELASALLDDGADPDAAAQGWTPLHQLVWVRRPNPSHTNPPPVPTGRMTSLELGRRLLTHGVNVNARQTKEPRDDNRHVLNRIGATPFLLAAYSSDLELMRLLLENGADPSLTNVDHTNALMVAAGVHIWTVGESPGSNDEALEAVKLLLDLGADVNAENDWGYTPLLGAAHRGSPEIVQLLVDRGARLDAKVKKSGGAIMGATGWSAGWTPLIIADGVMYPVVFQRSPETAALLRKLMKQRGMNIDESASTTQEAYRQLLKERTTDAEPAVESPR
jgi:ankyrin repeat protein